MTIRKRALPVHEALHRSLAHTASHVGQMVHIGKRFSGDDWDTLLFFTLQAIVAPGAVTWFLARVYRPPADPGDPAD